MHWLVSKICTSSDTYEWICEELVLSEEIVTSTLAMDQGRARGLLAKRLPGISGPISRVKDLINFFPHN